MFEIMPDRVVFIIFHQGIAPALTGTDNHTDLFCYFGVNKNYKKKYILTNDGKFEFLGKRNDVYLEYALPYYDGLIQYRGFMETSSYLHIYKNRLHLPYKFIGIAHYDMVWDKNIIRRLKGVNNKNQVLARTKGTIFSKKGWHRLMFAKRYPLDFVIDSYNRFFHTKHSKKDLEGKPLTLWQAYFVHHVVFEKLSSWLSVFVNEVYPWANRLPYETHWGFISGLSERAESIFFALQKDLVISEIGLEHSQDVVDRLKIQKEHYGARKSQASMNLIEAFKEQIRIRQAYKNDYKKLNIL